MAEELTVGSFLQTFDGNAPPPRNTGVATYYAPPGGPDHGASPLDSLRSTDAAIVTLFREIDSGAARYADFIGGPTGGAGAAGLNPQIFQRQAERLANLARENPGRFAAGVATQIGLQLLNRHGKLWNPVTLLPPPILQSFIATNLDIVTGTPRLLTGYDDSIPQGLVDTKPGFYEVNHGPRTGFVNDPNVLPPGQDLHVDLNRGRYTEVQMLYGPPFVKVETAGRGGLSVTSRISPRLVGARSQDTSLVDDPDRAPPRSLVDQALAERNADGPPSGPHDILPSTGLDGQRVVVGELVEDALGEARSFKKGHDGLPRFDISVLYEKKRVQLGGFEWRPQQGVARVSNQGPIERAAFMRGIVPVGIDGENELGFVTTDDMRKDITSVVDDDAAYVPLSFSDLRPINGKIRTVYFRPFITNLSEEFSPSWNKENYFGRVDPVATYQSTGRTVNLGFEIHVFMPEDLELAYRKLAWLTSMVYPEYDKDLVYASGPVLRMRVGNVIDSLSQGGLRGLPGILDNLSFDYTDSLWELKKDLKVPRSIRVSLSFTVLHDSPIGRGAGGKFGGIILPRPGSAGTDAGSPSGDAPEVNFARSFRAVGDANDYDPTKLR